MIGSVLGGIGLLAGTASNVANNIRQQRNFNEQMQFAKYQYENSKFWNSYQNQVRQMRAAGINPALSFGQGSQSVSSVSQPYPAQTGPLNMNGLNSFANTIASADINNDKTKAETDIEKLRAIGQDLNNFLVKNFGVKEKEGALNEQGQRIKESVQRALLLAAQGDYTKALVQLTHAQEFKTYAEGGKANQEMLNLQQEFEWYVALIKAKIGEMKMHSVELGASAEEHTAGADLKGEQAESQRFYNTLYKNPEVKSALTDSIKQAAENAKKHGKMTDQQVELLKYQCEQLQKANDNYEIQMWSGIINQTISTAANAFGEFTRFGMVKKFLESKPSMIESGRGYMLNEGGLLIKNPY